MCRLCNKKIPINSKGMHLKTHGYNSKLYYDSFLKKKNDGICPICGNETSCRLLWLTVLLLSKL